MATNSRRGHWTFCWCEGHFVYCWCAKEAKHALSLKTSRLRALERTWAGLRTLRRLRASCRHGRNVRAWAGTWARANAHAGMRVWARTNQNPSKSRFGGQDVAF